MKFGIQIDITSYPLTPSWNYLHILMHDIVLHISIYLFPWLHVLYDPRSINNDKKTCVFDHIHIRVFLEH